MSPEEITREVTAIVRDVLDNPALELMRETTANDIEEWDSLAHISIIVAIEKAFRIKFTLRELKPLKNVGELMDLIGQKSA